MLCSARTFSTLLCASPTGRLSELNCRLRSPWLAAGGRGTARGSRTRSPLAEKPVFLTPGVKLSLHGRAGRLKRPEPDSEATESPKESREDEIRAGLWIGTGSLRRLSKLVAASSLSDRRSARRKGTTLRFADPQGRLTGGVALRGVLLPNTGCAMARIVNTGSLLPPHAFAMRCC